MEDSRADQGGDLGRNVRQGLAWSTLNSLALRVGTFALGVALARLLSPEEFGVYAVALAIQAVLMTLADFGLSADLVRSDEPDRIAPTVGALGLTAGVVLAVTMALTAAPLADLLRSPESTNVIAALSLTLVLAGAGVVPYAMLQRNFRQKALFGIASIDFLISTTITVALVIAGWGVMSLAVGRVAAQSVTLVLQFRMSGMRPRYSVDRDVVRSVLAFGLPLAGANLLSWALLNIDNVVIARVAGVVALGFYVLAFNISSWPMTAIGQVVRSIALPAFARTRTTADGSSLITGTALTWALALPAGALLAALAPSLIEFVYGARWSPSAPVLAALGLFGAMRVVFDLIAAYLLAHGRSKTVLVVQLSWFVALVPAMIFGTRWFGIEGGGWAHLVVAVAVILPAYLIAVARQGVSICRLLAACLPPTAAAVVAAGAAFAVSQEIQRPLLALVGGGITGCAIYGALMFRWITRAIGDKSFAASAPTTASPPGQLLPPEPSVTTT